MILLTWGIPFVISVVSFIIALEENGWNYPFKEKTCWIEKNMSLIGTYYTLCIVYFIVSIIYLIISIHRTNVCMKEYGKDMVIKMFRNRLKGYFILMVFSFLFFMTHFVLFFIEKHSETELDNPILVSAKYICDSIIGPLFVFVYCSTKEVWTKFKNIVSCKNKQKKNEIEESIIMTIDTDASKSEEESAFS